MINTKKGFTLIELLVTIAIISLIASIIFASLSNAREKSQDTHKAAEAKEVEKAIELYRLSNNYSVPGYNSEIKGELHEEGSPQYETLMSELVFDGYISTVPSSPSGSDYAYIVSDDGKSAMFYSNQSENSDDVCVLVGDEFGDSEIDNYCGNSELATDEACFTFSSGAITDYDDECEKDVTIPSTIGGESVTGIGGWAFSNNNLTSVTIPDSVTSIGSSAFRFNNLSSITIPNSVNSIGHYVFYNNNLSSITISNIVTSIGTSVFAYNNLSSITIPDSVTSISWAAFASNPITLVDIAYGTTYETNSFPASCTAPSCIQVRD